MMLRICRKMTDVSVIFLQIQRERDKMIFRGIKENNGWMTAEYSATWRYGYDFMLDAAQIIIDTDFMDKLQRVATAETAGACDVERIDEVRERSARLSVGMSGVRRADGIRCQRHHGMSGSVCIL